MPRKVIQNPDTQGDIVGGDKIVVGDISGSMAAIGAGAKIIYQTIERALSDVEISEREHDFERRQVAEGIGAYVRRLEGQLEQSVQLSAAENPYKALTEYTISDAALFYGRTAAITSVFQCLERGPFTVLHADSGAGKTSLIKAGLMPHMLANGDVPLYVRPYQTSGDLALKRTLIARIDRAPTLITAPLYDFVREVSDFLGGRIMLVIFDQSEELFTVQGTETRMIFIEQLATCINDDSLPIKWLFAIRDEWFGQLGTFRPHIRQPYANEFLLRLFNKDEAIEVITQPAMRQNIGYDTGLLETLLNDLGNAEIAPPQLQLVCSALYDSFHDQRQFTLEMYNELGGTRGILRNHLDQVIRREVPPDQRKAASLLLEALITSDQRRALRTHNELANDLGRLGIDRLTLDSVLSILVDNHLLRAEETDDSDNNLAYELSHDYLLEEVKSDPEIQRRKALQELLQREETNWQVFGSTIGRRSLEHIMQDVEFIAISAEQLGLLIISSIIEHSDIDLLIDLANRHEQTERNHIVEVLSKMLQRIEDRFAKPQILSALGQILDASAFMPLSEALNDNEYAMRRSATQYLANHNNDSAKRALAEMAVADIAPMQDRAILALHWMGLDNEEIKGLVRNVSNVSSERLKRIETMLNTKTEFCFHPVERLSVLLVDDYSLVSKAAVQDLVKLPHVTDIALFVDITRQGLDEDAMWIRDILATHQIVLFFRADASRFRALNLKTQLVGFVEAGGMLVVGPWLTWGDNPEGLFNDLMPYNLDQEPRFMDATSATWTVTLDHPITNGLPSSFRLRCSYESQLKTRDGAINLIINQNNEPAVGILERGRGIVVYVNGCSYNMTGNDPWSVSTEFRQIYLNCIEWASSRYVYDSAQQ